MRQDSALISVTGDRHDTQPVLIMFRIGSQNPTALIIFHVRKKNTTRRLARSRDLARYKQSVWLPCLSSRFPWLLLEQRWEIIDIVAVAVKRSAIRSYRCGISGSGMKYMPFVRLQREEKKEPEKMFARRQPSPRHCSRDTPSAAFFGWANISINYTARLIAIRFQSA